MASDAPSAEELSVPVPKSVAREVPPFPEATAGVLSLNPNLKPSAATDERNGARARAKLQTKLKPAVVVKSAPVVATSSTDTSSAEHTSVDTGENYPEDVKEVVASLVRRIDVETLPGVARVMETLTRPLPCYNTQESTSTVAKERLTLFARSLDELSPQEAVWFVSSGGYSLMLMLISDDGIPQRPSDEPTNNFVKALFSVPDEAERMWNTMRAAFANTSYRSTAASFYFTDDIRYLALEGGLMPETILTLAKDFPLIAERCREIFTAMYEHFRKANAPPEQLMTILASIASFFTWSLHTRDVHDAANLKDRGFVSDLFARHLSKHPQTVAPHIDVLCNMTLAVLAMAAASGTITSDAEAVVTLLEAALNHGGPLARAVCARLVRENILEAFAFDVRHWVPPNLMKLLLIPYLPGGDDTRMARFPLKYEGFCTEQLLSSTAKGHNIAHLYGTLALCVAFAQPSHQLQLHEESWRQIAAENRPRLRIVQAIDAAIEGQLKFQSLTTSVGIASGRYNPLCLAAQADDRTGCSVLLACGWDPYAELSSSSSAFAIAVAKGAWEIVHLFFERSNFKPHLLFAVPLKSKEIAPRMTALAMMAYCGQTELMEALFKVAPNYAWHRHKLETLDPVRAAAHCNSPGPMEILLKHGVNIGEVTWKARPPLYFATETGAIETIRLLLQHGAPINHVIDGKGGGSFVGTAYHKKRWDILELLLKAGANPNLPINPSEEPVLNYAVTDQNLAITRLLLDHGAFLKSCQAFWLRQIAPDSRPDEIVLLLIAHGHQLEKQSAHHAFRGSWDHGPLRFIHHSPGSMSLDLQFRLVEIFLEFQYVSAPSLSNENDSLAKRAAALSVTTEHGTSKPLLPVAKLLVDFGCPTAGASELADYEPSPRQPKGAELITENGRTVRYVPWRPQLHQYSPRPCRVPVTAIVGLRVASAHDGSGWASLPLEIFEHVINCLFQSTRLVDIVSDTPPPASFTDRPVRLGNVPAGGLQARPVMRPRDGLDGQNPVQMAADAMQRLQRMRRKREHERD